MYPLIAFIISLTLAISKYEGLLPNTPWWLALAPIWTVFGIAVVSAISEVISSSKM